MSHINETYGTEERDILRSTNFRSETLFGLGGDDDIYVITQDLHVVDIAYGGAGDDRLYGGRLEEVLHGNAGDDLIDGGDYLDTASYIQATGGVVVSLLLQGTAQDTRSDGVDTLFNIERLQGSNFNDILRGDAGYNVLSGQDGDDQLRGGAGDDILIGGLGTDTVIYRDAEVGVQVDLEIRDAGQDTNWGLDHLVHVENVIGSSFGDRLVGDGFANKLDGSDGDDHLDGSSGDDLVLGGAGSDYLMGYLGDDTLIGGAGDDTFKGFFGNDELSGGDGDDLLNGGNGINRLDGGAGADSLLTGNNTDVLRGGTGDDSLTGGGGRDVLTGGEGLDMFVFGIGASGTTAGTADVIKDFEGEGHGDRIDLHSIDAVAGGEDDSFSFVGSQGFSGAAGELRFDVINGNTFVQGDIDGDKVADVMIRLDGLHDLAATDFVL
jgi:Ca2+-binding RTX toxin-like protein